MRNRIFILCNPVIRLFYRSTHSLMQFSYEDDMKLSIVAWEQATGQKWMNDSVPDYEQSSFPWERKGTFQYLDEAIRQHDWRRRRLLGDTPLLAA